MSTGEGGGASRPLPERPGETYVIRHEEEAHVGTDRGSAGFLRARKRVETVRVDEKLPLEAEQLDYQLVAAEEGDSGEVETLTDGSISIPIYEEELVVTKRTVLRERVIVRKHTVERRERVRAELQVEHVEIDADEAVEVVDER